MLTLTKGKKVGVAMLIPDKIDSKAKNVTKDREILQTDSVFASASPPMSIISFDINGHTGRGEWALDK